MPSAKIITEIISISSAKKKDKNEYQKFFNSKFKKFEIKNLNFSFSENVIFKNLNFIMKKNKIYGIQGESGSGKTTLLNILTGLYDTDSEIYFNDEKINSIKQIQNQICYVPQNVYLYDDTIINNIILGDNIDENIQIKVKDILKELKLDDLINSLPKGINTFVGENGTKLSGGQIQRIGLARAMYHKKEIIYLDEFTSALDNQTEKEILHFLKKLNRDLTIIIVTHRHEPLNICNEI